MSDTPIPKYALDPKEYLSEQLRVIERLAVGRRVLMRGMFEVRKAPWEDGDGPHPQYTTQTVGYMLIAQGLAKPSDAFGMIEALPRTVGLYSRLTLHPAWRTFLRDDEPEVSDKIGGKGSEKEPA